MARPRSNVRKMYVRIDGVFVSVPDVLAVLSNDKHVVREIAYTGPRLSSRRLDRVFPMLEIQNIRDGKNEAEV